MPWGGLQASCSVDDDGLRDTTRPYLLAPSTAATRAITAPPLHLGDDPRTVAYIRPSIAGGMAPTPPIGIFVRL